MERKKARNVIKSYKEINAQVKVAQTKESEVGNKLINGDDLTLEEIKELGLRITEQQGYDENQLIVCDVTELNTILMSHKDDDISIKPVFIICRTEKNVAAFCITKLHNQTVCLYKDFLNNKIPENIKIILEQCFGNRVDIKIHDEMEEKENQKYYYLLSLQTIKTMMLHLKADSKKDFIEGFNNRKKHFFEGLKSGVLSFKDELFSLVKEAFYKTVASDIDQLSKDTEFKNAIKNLINNIPSKEVVDDFKNYQTLLKEFLEIVDSEIHTIDTNTIKTLNEARQRAFTKTKILEIDISENEEGGTQLEISKIFPTQMEKFTRVFEPFIRCKMDDNSDKILKEICEKLDLEYDKLKSFIEVKEAKKQDEIYNTSNIRNIDDLISALPKPKPEAIGLIKSKPFEQLLAEIIVEKPNTLKEGYNKVKHFYKLWKDKDAFDVNFWAVSRYGQLADSEIYEALAIMDKANELVTGGQRLRDTQIISVLTFLQQKNKCQLSQIQTGEGKTTIVSILAAINTLQGHTVDIVTSNPILASEAIKDKTFFYNILGLSVATNNLDETYESGERECYKADIVYGSIGNFQFDYLKDSFLGLKTRAGRPFKNLILDEVDSMIIDNACHIAKLSQPLPGMESLKYIYIKIWIELHKAEETIVKEFQVKLKEKAEELNSQNLPDDEAQASYEKYEDQLKDSIIQKIKDNIKIANPTKVDIIPSHIQEYADSSLDRWIDNAIRAKYDYHEDKQYIIRVNKDGEEVIQPVDYANTGITLKNTIWQYGLHQFLQLKHNLHLTSESLTSCFISNFGYINKYDHNIFGLSGTLGSEAERQLLSSIYQVQYVSIPTYKDKKFEEVDGKIVDDICFSEKVVDDGITELQNGRACLIICETIKDAKEIQRTFKKRKKNISTRIFFDERNAHITEEHICSGDVVIATNIAGRGTDFRTSAVLESNGGLHVCVAFLPCNKRVEDQAFGRTARQGNYGTAKLIIKKSELKKLGNDSENFTTIKSVRDLKEEERLKEIEEFKIQELKFQDQLFELFSCLCGKLKRDNESKGEYKFVLNDLKEFWAFWLEKNKGSKLAKQSPEKEFAKFEAEASETIIKGHIQFNPYYSIQQAEHFILNEELDEAEKALLNAIEISKNPEILHSAYIKLFEISVEKGGVLMDKFREAVGNVFFINSVKPKKEYKENAKRYLKLAQAAFKKELDHIESIVDAEEFTNIIISNDNTEVNDESIWLSDQDMHIVGENILGSLGINTNVQFRNRLTKDQVETFCKECQLEDQVPVFICYNIGGQTNENGGIHWVGMCIVQIQDRVKLLYKDPKGDFENNAEVTVKEFTKFFNNLDFIIHTGSEQSDNSSCGPMTLENLKIMATSIQKDGVLQFIENFTGLKFSQQRDVSDFGNTFANILPYKSRKTENLFIKHIVSKQQALSLNMNDASNLVEQINTHKGGIFIGCRISDYFLNLKPQTDNENKIKNTITNCELSELAVVGTNTTYALKEAHEVTPEIVTGARMQIAGGISLICVGLCIPLALPFTSSISGTMITEGLCDIAIEVINKNSDGKFNMKSYVKGKVISYGVTLLTMGIKAALQCPKILKAATRACRWMSRTLRKCPIFLKTCEYLATKFDKLGDLFEKMETISKFSKMTKMEKLSYVDKLDKSNDLKRLKYLGENIKEISSFLKELQDFGKLTELSNYEKWISTVQTVAISVGKSLACSVIMSKIVTPILSSFMSKLKPTIRKHVDKSVRENIDKDKLKYTTYEHVQNIIKDSINVNTVRAIFKDTILGLTKNCNNWRIQLGALAIDQIVSWEEVYNYAKKLCKQINDNITSTADCVNNDVEEMINQIIEQFTEEMYSQVVSTTIKTCKDVYSVGTAAYENYKQEKMEEAICIKIYQSFKEGGQAGQEQAIALSDVIKRPIYIYDQDGNIAVTIGEEQYLGDPVEITYFLPDESSSKGHYVPYGKNSSWYLDDQRNDCLFNAIGSQIGEDSSKLRQNTEKQIERDPTRYMAPFVRETIGDSVLLLGGRRNIPISDVHYPSYKGRIKISKKKHVLSKLRNDLTKYIENLKKFNNLKLSKKLQHIKCSKSEPCFGTVPDKTEMMMGMLSVEFTNGETLNITTVSGDKPFCVRQSISDIKDAFDEDYTPEPIPYKWKYIGFTFVDPGKPKGKVFDVYSRQEINCEYNSSCAAQKLTYFLGNHMKKNPELQLKKDIYMAEAWHKPVNATFSPGQVIIEESCSKCKEILPKTTGQESGNF